MGLRSQAGGVNPVPYIPVAGTWERGRNDPAAWFRTGSLFDRRFARGALIRVDQNGDTSKPDAGYWSGDLGGMLYEGGSSHRVWQYGGEHLSWFVEQLGLAGLEQGGPLVAVLHSHGGQVGAYALARIPMANRPANIHFVTVDMPVRRDMRAIYAMAKRRCRRWVHLYSDRLTPMRLLGSRFGPRRLEVADANIHIEGGHSGVLRDPRFIGQWDRILPEVL